MRDIVIFIVMVIVASCGLYFGYDPSDFYLQNDSNTVITYYFPTHSTQPSDLAVQPCYPDTSITFPWWKTIGDGVVSNEKTLVFKGLVQGVYSVHKADTLSFFIFDNRLIDGKKWVEDSESGGHWENEVWDKAVEEYDVLVRYDLSLDDLNKLRDDKDLITLHYPPSTEMKDIKMWPPYEEVIKNASKN
ncbi:MAG: hypothetical protein ACI3ZQ_07980 [Candidatus Cryptobacteroides sp.]